MAGKPKTRAKKAAPVTVEAIKGFDRNLSCRGFQYEIGKEYSVEGKIVPCSNGFHACPVDTVDPLRVFGFYAPGISRYCIVDQGGEIVPHDDDKAASSTIFIRREIGISEIIDRALKYRMERAKPTGETATGNYGAASATGDCGAASATGEKSAAMASGYDGKVSAAKGCALFAVERDSNWNIISTASGIAGRDGLKPDTFYRCKNGKFEEVK